MNDTNLKCGTTHFTVYPRMPSALRRVFLLAAYLTLLVLAVGVSRVWFGGAWVIDVIVFILFTIGTLTLMGNHTGKFIGTTPSEIRAWFVDGCPRDFLAWREDRKNGVRYE